ncbi:MAG: RNA polymerase sigma factor [Candidatus Omnitrophota bacterium]
MQHFTDEQLILSYQKGEPGAMDELLRRYKNPVYHFSYRLCLNAAEAQDITQEVFLRVHQYKDDYKPLAKFSTWLFCIAHNVFISRVRKQKWFILWPRKHDCPEEYVEFPSPDPTPCDAAQERDFSALLQRSIQSLPFLQREALILREYQDLDYQEISKILKKSLGTVKTLIYRARQSLKIKLLPYVAESKGGSYD